MQDVKVLETILHMYSRFGVKINTASRMRHVLTHAEHTDVSSCICQHHSNCTGVGKESFCWEERWVIFLLNCPIILFIVLSFSWPHRQHLLILSIAPKKKKNLPRPGTKKKKKSLKKKIKNYNNCAKWWLEYITITRWPIHYQLEMKEQK